MPPRSPPLQPIRLCANETGGPLNIWRQWAPQAMGQPIDSGHFLTEENPEATAKALLAFFSAS